MGFIHGLDLRQSNQYFIKTFYEICIKCEITCIHARLLIMVFDVTDFVVSVEHTKYHGFIITLTTHRIQMKRSLFSLVVLVCGYLPDFPLHDLYFEMRWIVLSHRNFR